MFVVNFSFYVAHKIQIIGLMKYMEEIKNPLNNSIATDFSQKSKSDLNLAHLKA